MQMRDNECSTGCSCRDHCARHNETISQTLNELTGPKKKHKSHVHIVETDLAMEQWVGQGLEVTSIYQ